MPLADAGEVAHRLSETEVIAYVLVDLALIVAAARLVGGLFVRLQQPRIVGEIVAGILLGPTLLGGSVASAADDPGSGLVNELFPFEAFEFLNVLATLALVFFMLLVGLEVEQRFFRGRGRQIVVLALALTIVPFLIGFGVAALLDEPNVWRALTARDGSEVPFVTHGLFIGAGLAVTAFPVMARFLEDRNLLSSELGAVAIGAAAISLPLMFVIIASAFATGPHGVPESAAVKLVLAVALALFLFVVVRPALRWVLARRYSPGEELDAGLFALLLIGTFLSAAVADRIGVQALTGGFLFGAAVPQLPGLAQAMLGRLHDLVVIVLIPVLLTVAGLHTGPARVRPRGRRRAASIPRSNDRRQVGRKRIHRARSRPLVARVERPRSADELPRPRDLDRRAHRPPGRRPDRADDGRLRSGCNLTTLMTGPLFDRFAPRVPDAEAVSAR